MPGETDLRTLLRAMEPVLEPGEFVFATCAGEVPAEALCRFREREGTSLILRREEAERLGLTHTYRCRMITLTIHSSLEAVGLLAAVAGRLAEERISVNTVSAWHHDHLFVRTEDAARAMAALRALSAGGAEAVSGAAAEETSEHGPGPARRKQQRRDSE